MLTSMVECVCKDRPDSLRSHLFGFLKEKYPTEAAGVPGLEEKMTELGPWATRADVAPTQEGLMAYLDAIKVRDILEVILEAALREQPKNAVAFVMHRIYFTTPDGVPPALGDPLPAEDDCGGNNAVAAAPPVAEEAPPAVGALAGSAPAGPEATAEPSPPVDVADTALVDTAPEAEAVQPAAADSALEATISEQSAPQAASPDAPMAEVTAEPEVEASPEAALQAEAAAEPEVEAAPEALQSEAAAEHEVEAGAVGTGAAEAEAAKADAPAEAVAAPSTDGVLTEPGSGGQGAVEAVAESEAAETTGGASVAVASLFAAVAAGDAAQVQAALAAGAPVDSTNSAGQTALHLAAEGEPAVVGVLLATEGCPLDAVDTDGRTALMLAIAYQDGDSVDRLVSAGASADVVDAAGRSTAAYAEASADAAIIKAVTGKEVSTAGHVPPRPGSRSMSKRPSFTSGRLDPASIDRASIPIVEKSEEAQSRIRAAVSENVLFKALEEETLHAMVMAMEAKSVKEGEAVVTQGEASRCFYVVESGSFSIYKYDQEADPAPQRPGDKVWDVSEKDSFGETALMYAERSDVSVIATADAKLWTLDRDTFRALQLSAAARGEEEKE